MKYAAIYMSVLTASLVSFSTMAAPVEEPLKPLELKPMEIKPIEAQPAQVGKAIKIQPAQEAAPAQQLKPIVVAPTNNVPQANLQVGSCEVNFPALLAAKSGKSEATIRRLLQKQILVVADKFDKCGKDILDASKEAEVHLIETGENAEAAGVETAADDQVLPMYDKGLDKSFKDAGVNNVADTLPRVTGVVQDCAWLGDRPRPIPAQAN